VIYGAYILEKNLIKYLKIFGKHYLFFRITIIKHYRVSLFLYIILRSLKMTFGCRFISFLFHHFNEYDIIQFCLTVIHSQWYCAFRTRRAYPADKNSTCV